MNQTVLLMLCFLFTSSISSAQEKDTSSSDIPSGLKSHDNAGRLDSVFGSFSKRTDSIFAPAKEHAFGIVNSNGDGKVNGIMKTDYSGVKGDRIKKQKNKHAGS